MCEMQHFKKIKIGHDPCVPQNYYKAIRDKERIYLYGLKLILISIHIFIILL